MAEIRASKAQSIECSKIKIKVVTLANRKGRSQSTEPIKTRSKHV